MFSQVNIETCTQCNSRCRFCPVSSSPPSPGVMPVHVFNVLLTNVLLAQPATAIEWVALNHYSEPLLDPWFLNRVRELGARGLRLRLFTNGQLLRPQVTNALVVSGNVESVIVNLPDLDPVRYQAKTGVDRLPDVLLNLDYAIHRLPVVICVNGNGVTQADELGLVLADMRRRWGSDVVLMNPETNSRAGLVSSPETRATPHRDRLTGCTLVDKQLNIDVDGNVFLCCQDYYKQYVYGNLLDFSLEMVCARPFAKELRGIVRGEIPAPQNMICRYCDVGVL